MGSNPQPWATEAIKQTNNYELHLQIEGSKLTELLFNFSLLLNRQTDGQ